MIEAGPSRLRFGSPRARDALAGVALIAGFVAYRWVMRVEPLNSDDLTLFGIASAATEGRHWLLAGVAPPQLHQHLRLGVLPLFVPFIQLLGPTQLAFYAAPIAVSTLGFWLCWRIMRKETAFGFALAFALFHVALPLEVMRASLPLVDLPSSVFVLLTLFLVDRLAKPDPDRFGDAIWRGAVAGLAGVEAYLLRTNSAVLLVPGLALFATSRRTRRIAVVAAFTILVGIGLEQLFYMAQGEAFGFRWHVVRAALDKFSPFLPVVPFEDFLGRYFRFAFRAYGGGRAGQFMCGFLAVSLAAHVFALIRGASMIRALAATGLFTYIAFAYGIYSWNETGIHALGPENYRYLQLFYYTSIVLLAWGAGRVAAGFASLGALRRPALAILSVGIAGFTLAPFYISAQHVGPRVASDAGLIRAVTCALDHAAQTNGGAVSVYSTLYTSRVLQLFRGPWSEPAVDWKLESIDEILERSAESAPFLFFDHWRLQLAARYKAGDASEAYLDSLVRLDDRLWRAYEPLTGRQRGTLYRQRADGREPEQTPLHWRKSSGPLIEELEGREFRVVATPGTGRFSVFASGAEPRGTPVAGSLLTAIDGESVYALRFHLDHPESVSVEAILDQLDGRDLVARERFALRQSWNTLHFDAAHGAMSFGLSLAIEPEDLEAPAAVSIRDTELQTWPARARCGDSTPVE